MNFQELLETIGNNSFTIDNCKLQATVQVIEGKPTLQLDLFTVDFETYDTIQQEFVSREVKYLEHYYEPTSSTITRFNISTNLNLFLLHPESR